MATHPPAAEPHEAGIEFHPPAANPPHEKETVAPAEHGAQPPPTEHHTPEPKAEHGHAAAEPAAHAKPAESHAAAHGEKAAAALGADPTHLSPQEAKGLVNLGRTLTERGDYAAAEIAFRQVLNGHTPVDTTKNALLELARMHRRQGYLTKAIAIYERYIKDYPDDERVPDALLDLGRTLRDMGAPKLAITRFYNVINSTLKLSTSNGFAHYQLLAKTAQFEVAETYFQQGDYAEATKFYSRLRMLDLAPVDRARAHFKAAYSLQLAGDFEGAVTSLRSYLEQWPDDENAPEAQYLLATTLRTLNRTQESLSATIDLLKMEKSRTAQNPKRWAYWQRRTGNQLANDCFQGGDIHNALVIYQGLVALSEDPAWRAPVTYQVALCYERLNDLPSALKTYHGIINAAGATPGPEIADIVRMAESRLAHLEWSDNIDRQVASYFDSTTGQPSSGQPPKSSAAHDANRSPAPASPAL